MPGGRWKTWCAGGICERLRRAARVPTSVPTTSARPVRMGCGLYGARGHWQTTAARYAAWSAAFSAPRAVCTLPSAVLELPSRVSSAVRQPFRATHDLSIKAILKLTLERAML